MNAIARIRAKVIAGPGYFETRAELIRRKWREEQNAASKQRKD